MQLIPEKIITMTSLIACVTCLMTLTFTPEGAFWVLCLARFLFGFFQIILISYLMAWVETFAESKFLRAIQFHMILFGQALAYFMGYALAAFMIIDSMNVDVPE